MCFTKRKIKMMKKYKIHPEPITENKNKPTPKHNNLLKPPVFINQNSYPIKDYL